MILPKNEATTPNKPPQKPKWTPEGFRLRQRDPAAREEWERKMVQFREARAAWDKSNTPPATTTKPANATTLPVAAVPAAASLIESGEELAESAASLTYRILQSHTAILLGAEGKIAYSG